MPMLFQEPSFTGCKFNIVIDKVSEPEEAIAPVIYPRDQHNVSRSKIDPDALKIMYRLARNGFKAYLVGGGVRDVVLGKTPKDFDIATDATPRQVKSLFRNSRIIGRRFKLVHIFFNIHKIIEVSTFRDVSVIPEPEDAGEVPTIAQDNNFGDEATDALRRDLTINALFYDISTYSIIDYVGGMIDLRAGVIRVIGDTDVRLAEDPVRLLRIVRHAARNNFQIEERCYESLVRNRELLSSASQVRVFEEIKKDLTSGSILPILRLLHKTQLLSLLIPALSEASAELLEEGTHLPICLERLDQMAKEGSPVSPTVVLTLLLLYTPSEGQRASEIYLHDRFESDEAIADHVKYVYSKLLVPRKERERIEALAKAWQRCCSVDGDRVKGSVLARGTEIHDLISLYTIVLGSEDDDPVLRALRSHTGRRQNSDSRPRRGNPPKRKPQRRSPPQ